MNREIAGSTSDDAPSSRDLPLWARGVVGGLLVVTSWWLLSAEGIRGLVGSSVGVAVLGIVSASSLRGMHLPLGLWPDGPWRARFSVGIVVSVAVVFGGLMVLADPQAPSALELIDPGAFAMVVLGVVIWGFTWSLVLQRPFVSWYAVATMLGLAPFFTGVLTKGLADPDGLCLLMVDTAAGCEGATLRVVGFLTATYAALGLVTIEITFRRLLIGGPKHANAVLIAASAVLFTVWTILVGPDAPLAAVPWWLALCGAVTAGTLYALGGSLLVSSLYTALIYASYLGVLAGRPEAATAGVGVPFIAAIVLTATGMLGVVIHQRGFWSTPQGGRS